MESKEVEQHQQRSQLSGLGHGLKSSIFGSAGVSGRVVPVSADRSAPHVPSALGVPVLASTGRETAFAPAAGEAVAQRARLWNRRTVLLAVAILSLGLAIGLAVGLSVGLSSGGSSQSVCDPSSSSPTVVMLLTDVGVLSQSLYIDVQPSPLSTWLVQPGGVTSNAEAAAQALQLQTAVNLDRRGTVGNLFVEWTKQYKMNYSSLDEATSALTVFDSSVDFLLDVNLNATAGSWAALNQFSATPRSELDQMLRSVISDVMPHDFEVENSTHTGGTGNGTSKGMSSAVFEGRAADSETGVLDGSFAETDSSGEETNSSRDGGSDAAASTSDSGTVYGQASLGWIGDGVTFVAAIGAEVGEAQLPSAAHGGDGGNNADAGSSGGSGTAGDGSKIEDDDSGAADGERSVAGSGGDGRNVKGSDVGDGVRRRTTQADAAKASFSGDNPAGAGSSRRRLAAQLFVNWTAAERLTPVKDQGRCGSSYAHAALSAVEAGIALQYPFSTPTTFSRQMLVSCANLADSDVYSSGCTGGQADAVIAFMAMYTIPEEAAYPYTSGVTGVAGACDAGLMRLNSSADNWFKINGYEQFVTPQQALGWRGVTYITTGDEKALMAAVVLQPVVCYWAIGPLFVQYGGGVYHGGNDCGAKLDHVMLAVGFDATSKFWILQNSWATTWGERGTIRVAMSGTTNGVCGMYQKLFAPQLSFATMPSSITHTSPGAPPSPGPPHPPKRSSPPPPPP